MRVDPDIARIEARLEEIHGPLPEYRPNQRNGFVYFIEGPDGEIKIGWARDPKRRLASLQTSHSTPLKILALWKTNRENEKALHTLFDEQRVRGEWFRPSPALLALIEEHAS